MLQTRNSKKRRRGGPRVWRFKVFRQTLTTSLVSPADPAHTDTTQSQLWAQKVQCPAPVGKNNVIIQ